MQPSPNPRSKQPLTHVVYHILLALTDGPLHGYGIIKEVEGRTGGETVLEAGTLYAALKRLKEKDLVEVTGTGVHQGRQRRDYGLTASGHDALAGESHRLAELVSMAKAKRVLPADSAS